MVTSLLVRAATNEGENEQRRGQGYRDSLRTEVLREATVGKQAGSEVRVPAAHP